MDILLTRTLEALAYPPAGPLLLVFLGTLFLAYRWRLGYALMSLGWVYLYFASIPFTAQALAGFVETEPALSPAELARHQAQAIVVLGGARYPQAPEYGGDTSGAAEMERLRYAAYLQRKTGLPLAVIGGDPLGTGISEAVLMRAVLEKEFQVPVRWSDGRSTNTFDNARYAHEILAADGVQRIFLVTHASHMTRAKRAFAAEGFEVVAAPTAFTTPSPEDQGWRQWLPSITAETQINRFLHELIGQLWYRLFYA